MFLKLLFIGAFFSYAIAGFGQSNTARYQNEFHINDQSHFPKLISRSLETTAPGNYLLQTPALGTPFVEILLRGMKSGAIQGYRSDNESVALTKEDLIFLLRADTSSSSVGFILESTTKFYMKEEWMFFKDKGRMIVRITGIAPIITVKDTAGVKHEQPAFWLRYEDIRDYLAIQKVTPISKDKNVANLRDVMDGRYFTSEIISKVK